MLSSWKVLNHFRCHIVHYVEFWFEASAVEAMNKLLECTDGGIILGITKRFDQDKIGFPFLKYEKEILSVQWLHDIFQESQ